MASSKDSKSTAVETVELEVSSIREILSFIPDQKCKLVYGVAIIAAIGSGFVMPSLAYVFSNSFSKLGTNITSAIEEIAHTFLVIGAIAFVLGLTQTFCADHVARKTTANFRQLWFRALLRQDTAYYDVNNVSGFATTISSNAKKIEYGLGKKAVDGVQNVVTVLAGLAYAFYASWKTALVVLGVVPLIAISSMMVIKLNQSQTLSATKSYTKAGSIAYQTVSSIRTILALNAVPEVSRIFVCVHLFEHIMSTQDSLHVICHRIIRYLDDKTVHRGNCGSF